MALYLILVGVAFMTSSLSIFIPDIGNFVSIVTNIGFWVTPVFWNPSMVPERWRWILDLNPAFYCVKGFRDTFLFDRWLWERGLWEHAVFWSWTCLALILGGIIFKKLRPCFADEL